LTDNSLQSTDKDPQEMHRNVVAEKRTMPL